MSQDINQGPGKAALERKLATVPDSPGVYMFRDARYEVIYVGKALSLRKRVQFYFQPGSDGRALYAALIARIADLDYVLTDTEKEALLLENNLIKQFHPRFNINLRDDKGFVFLRIDRRHPYPRARFPAGRERVRANVVEKTDRVLQFGPFASARAARATLRLINRVFPLRKCSDYVFRHRVRPCLYHQMGQCLGPCCGLTDEATYQKVLDQAVLFLRGRAEDVLKSLRSRMEEESAGLHYEDAARTRDQIRAIDTTLERQKITSVELIDRDIFGSYCEGDWIEIQAMFVRRGRMEELTNYRLRRKGYPEAEALGAFLKQFYGRHRFTPKEILLPLAAPDGDVLAEWLSELKGQKVHLLVPKMGEKRRLVELAVRNARNAHRLRAARPDREQVLAELQSSLGMTRRPDRIECFDISNIGGRLAVGSMVTFARGEPDKSSYRRYRIKTVTQSDDLAMLREVLRRRYRRALAEGNLPDLAVVDGGAGQVSAALDVFRELAIEDVVLIGLAKGRAKPTARGEKRRTEERVFLAGGKETAACVPGSAAFQLLQRVRDEAHRFAIQYHRKLRQRSFTQSPLELIPGVGPAAAKQLLAHFGTLAKVKSAALDQLQAMPGLKKSQASSVFDYFHGTNEERGRRDDGGR